MVHFPMENLIIANGNGKWTIEIGNFPSYFKLHSVRGFSSQPFDVKVGEGEISLPKTFWSFHRERDLEAIHDSIRCFSHYLHSDSAANFNKSPDGICIEISRHSSLDGLQDLFSLG